MIHFDGVLVRHPPVRRARLGFGLLVLASILAAGGARAEVQVEGNVAALRLQVKEARVTEVLSALASLNVRFRTSIPLDRVVDGMYAGPLGRVLPRVLEGYNFIVMRTADAVEVIVVGTPADNASQPPPASRQAVPPSSTNVAANSRHER